MDTLTATRARGFYYVNWWLMNHCNYNCGYCHEIIKSGSIDQVGLAAAQDFVNQLGGYCRTQGLRPRVDITGGEITLWPGLNILLATIHDWQGFTHIHTNCSQTITDFESTLANVDSVELAYHPEYATASHFWQCVNKAQELGIETRIVFNMMPERWSETNDLYEKLHARWPQIHMHRRMLFQDPAVNHKPQQYTQEQTVKLVRQTGDLVWTGPTGSEYTDYQTLVLEDRNHFKGWQCNIGLEQIIVDAWGRVTRGHCRQGGTIGQLGSTIDFDVRGVICTRDSCANAFDILATKQRLS